MFEPIRMIYAVVPAAGQSRRMGQPKLTLPLGSTTVIETVVTTLRVAGMSAIVVVTARGMVELERLATAAGADVCVLSDVTAEMRVTVKHGLQWIESRFHPQDQDAWLLVPADHPALETETITQLLGARWQQRDQSVWVPTYKGRRGHPVLISWKHVAELRKFASDQGINVYLRQCAAEVCEVPVQSEAILFDMDSPEDYRKMLSS